MTTTPLDPKPILDIGFGFWPSKVLLSALELGDAFDYSGADFAGWCRDAGFKRTEVIPLRGPASAAVAYK